MLYRNPAELVQLPKVRRQEMSALSPQESARFMAALERDRYSALFALALSTGMRPAEYLGLRWIDVEMSKATVTVQRSLVWRTKGGGWYFTQPKTSRSRRTIPLPPSMAVALLEHKRRQSEERMKLGADWQDHGLVFTTPLGSPLNISNLTSKHFKPALRRAGLPTTIRLYDLRHTCATLLLGAGENPKVVSERLGHASIVLTIIDEDRNFVGPRNRAGRFPNFASLDLQVLKSVSAPGRFSENYQFRVGVKVFNVTNHFNPRDYQGNLASDEFGGFYNGVGRKFGLKFVVEKK